MLKSQETKPIIDASLQGTVVDAVIKLPIEGATVQLDTVTHSVKSNREGLFQFVTGLKLPVILIVSYVGYETRSIVVKSSPAVIELSVFSEGLEEVVVVGYGTQKQGDLVGKSVNMDLDFHSFDGELLAINR